MYGRWDKAEDRRCRGDVGDVERWLWGAMGAHTRLALSCAQAHPLAGKAEWVGLGAGESQPVRGTWGDRTIRLEGALSLVTWEQALHLRMGGRRRCRRLSQREGRVGWSRSGR